MQSAITYEEMKRLYPSEWLLIIDPQTNEKHEIEKGIVEFHSKNRDELYRHAVALKPRRFATVFTGRLPKDTAVILSAFLSMPQLDLSPSEPKFPAPRGVRFCSLRWIPGQPEH